jgi:trehalose-6-phosphate synthase
LVAAEDWETIDRFESISENRNKRLHIDSIKQAYSQWENVTALVNKIKEIKGMFGTSKRSEGSASLVNLS